MRQKDLERLLKLISSFNFMRKFDKTGPGLFQFC